MPKAKALRFKCTSCARLLPAEHFARGKAHPSARVGGLMCAACTKVCAHCAQRLPLSKFASQASELCDKCEQRREAADSNVYFRYPTLRYKASPFSVDKFRTSLTARDQ